MRCLDTIIHDNRILSCILLYITLRLFGIGILGELFLLYRKAYDDKRCLWKRMADVLEIGGEGEFRMKAEINKRVELVQIQGRFAQA